MMASPMLSSIDLHPLLRERITQTYPFTFSADAASTNCSAADTATGTSANTNASGTSTSNDAANTNRLNAILYLPTVVLRYEHNPAFALACHVANAHNLPVIVLAVIPDDKSVPRSRSGTWSGDGAGGREVAMTSRRLAFHLEALSSATPSWSTHGAAVFIRVHGAGCRTPDHLTLARRCRFVVTDEPFVDPYLGLVEKVERACWSSGVECVRVDGSTTVPPAAVLRRRRRGQGLDDGAAVLYDGVPARAWQWQKRTEGRRMAHVQTAIDGKFDAPELKAKIDRDCFFDDPQPVEEGFNTSSMEDDAASLIEPSLLPSSWRNPKSPAPGTRPWTVADIANLTSNEIKSWARKWPGANSTVAPCVQTVGTTKAGMRRWREWLQADGLVHYAKRRNDPRHPRAPSRMSCYLNLGVVSVFRLVHEVKAAQARKVGGADKYEEEIVKWREMSYAHAFSRKDYAGVSSVPQWAVQFLEKIGRSTCASASSGLSPLYDLDSLAVGSTDDDKWNAMQRYLVNTGELHNNVRMTWGKTLVHWADRYSSTIKSEGETSVTETVLQTLCYLNDQYALDGLSPPSYAGLLWCMGWCDKPGAGGGISAKPASRYRCSPNDFRHAEMTLLGRSDGSSPGNGSISRHMSQSSLLDLLKQRPKPQKRQRTEVSLADSSSPSMETPQPAARLLHQLLCLLLRKTISVGQFLAIAFFTISGDAYDGITCPATASRDSPSKFRPSCVSMHCRTEPFTAQKDLTTTVPAISPTTNSHPS